MRKIGLFGGTFDPVHLGHVHLAELARAALDLDEVRFIPCHISPHKPGTPPTKGEDRAAMLQLATAAIPWAIIDLRELQRQGPSYSFETAEAIATEFPAARLFWIMGGDQWEALSRWKNPERLAAAVEFIVIARGTPPKPREGYRLHIVPGSHPASSTDIRTSASAGHPWLHPDVAVYIGKRALYQE